MRSKREKGSYLTKFRIGIILCFLFLLVASACWAAPTVTAVNPPDGGSASPNTTVAATFSEGMDPATITTDSFTLSLFVGFRAVATGALSSWAIKNDGTVAAWGGSPAVPAGLTGVVAVAAGNGHTLAVKDDGTVVAWGNNFYGQCNVPAGLTGVVAVAAGSTHSVALKNDGTVIAWGWNGYGICDVPAGLTGVEAISAMGKHTVALKNDGTVVAWGFNGYGEGDVPAGLTGVVAVAAGEIHTVALKNDGTVVAWGYNGNGECNVPAGLAGVTDIAAGGIFTVALKNDGTVSAWGYNDGPQWDVPAGLTGVTDIAAGANHTVALKNDGTVVGWGFDNYGQCTPPVGAYDTAVGGSVFYDQAASTARFTPAAPLSPNIPYFATVNASSRSLTGVPLDTDFRWGFSVIVDITPPEVTGTDPLDGAVEVPPGKSIAVTFSENIHVVPPESNILVYDEKRGLPINKTLIVSGSTLTIIPEGLIKNTMYSVSIPPFSIIDLAGNEMAVDNVFYFTTVKK